MSKPALDRNLTQKPRKAARLRVGHRTMLPDDIRPEDVRGRSTTEKLLPERPQEALEVARQIRHPWYRCQALSSVAEAVSSRADALRILAEALSAAREQAEPNRIVTVGTGPLRKLLELNPEAAAREVESLMHTALREEHGLRRLHALDFLLAAVVAHPSLRAQVAHPYLHTAQCCHGWRAERTIAFRSEHLAAFDLPLAHQLLAGRQPNRFVNKARQTLSSQFDQSKCRQQ